MCHKIRTAMRHRDGHYKLAGLIELDDASFGHKGEKNTRAGGTEKAVRVLVSTTDEGKPKFAKMAVADYAGVLQAQKMVREQVESNQVIRTDGGLSFPALKELGFEHDRHVGMTPQADGPVAPMGFHSHRQRQAVPAGDASPGVAEVPTEVFG